MNVQTIYPITTGAKVTQVADPTESNTAKETLNEVLQNMAKTYASLDKTGEKTRSEETWHIQYNHIDLGGLKAEDSYANKTAMDLLKVILSPVYYPYAKPSNVSGMSSVLKNANQHAWYTNEVPTSTTWSSIVTHPTIELENPVTFYSYGGNYEANSVGAYTLSIGRGGVSSNIESLEDCYKITVTYSNVKATKPTGITLQTSDPDKGNVDDLGTDEKQQSPSLSFEGSFPDTKSLDQKQSISYIKFPIVLSPNSAANRTAGNYTPYWWEDGKPYSGSTANKKAGGDIIGGDSEAEFYLLEDFADKDIVKITYDQVLNGKTYTPEVTSYTIDSNTTKYFKKDGNVWVEDLSPTDASKKFVKCTLLSNTISGNFMCPQTKFTIIFKKPS